MINKFKKAINFLLLVGALYMVPMMAIAIPTYSGFTTRADGYVVTAANWNGEFGNLISFINTNLVGALNSLSAKGYLLTFDGSQITSLQNAGSGDNGKMLALNSAQSTGLQWVAPIANSANLTTKGDLVGFTTNLSRIPVGTNTQVLTANSAVAAGVDWETVPGIPQGCIVMWSGTIAAIPTGWALCDGLSHTYLGNTSTPPNLQGLFLVGAGNASPAATSGAGLIAPGGPFGDVSAGAGLGPTVPATLTFQLCQPQSGGAAVSVVKNVVPGTLTPRYYALAYIQKL